MGVNSNFKQIRNENIWTLEERIANWSDWEGSEEKVTCYEPPDVIALVAFMKEWSCTCNRQNGAYVI